MGEQLDWTALLNSRRRKPRPGGKAHEPRLGEDRTQHERDHDRILFSTPVRRLQDKTQVFPLERNDSVRTRLTHSHEVANMARSMGTTLAFVHGEALGFPASVEPLRNVPALLEAIGLAHDLGNPPFGHQGETAIQTWMKRHATPRSEEPGSFAIFDAPGLTEPMRRDFLAFEGNAQAFRLLTRLQILNDDFGLNMTYAFLAALMKYPVPSDAVDKSSHARKKFNFFQSEAGIAAEVWAETGLRQGVRHPLTFVMEACDDIAYSVVDVEDAAKKNLINFNVLTAWLRHDACDDEVTLGVCERAERYHADFRGSRQTDGFGGLERAFAGGDEVFYHDYFLAGLDGAFDEVLKAVVLRSRANVNIGETHLVGNECTLGDCACGHSGYGIGLGEVLHNQAAQFGFDECAHFGVGEGLAVVSVDGGVPSKPM